LTFYNIYKDIKINYLMNILQKYQSVNENHETLITIIIYDKKIPEIITYFENELSKAQKITNPFKKNKINNRLYNFINVISSEMDLEKNISSIFLLSESMIEYKLTTSEIKTAKEYNLPKIFVKTDTFFCIDYILDFFYNFNFIYNIKLSNDISIGKSNKNKEKILDSSKTVSESKILEYIEIIRKNNEYKELIIIYGKSPILTKLNPIPKKCIIIHDKILTKEEIYQEFEKEMYVKNNEILAKRLNDLNNSNTNLDLYIFGKLKIEIKEAIESYIVKELFIEEHKYEKLKLCIEPECFNFTVYFIKSLENGDSADNFIKNYNGLMGLKYY